MLILSCGKKYFPRLPSSDLQIDARKLPNPYNNSQLRDLTGLDLPVQRYLSQSSTWRLFLGSICRKIRDSEPKTVLVYCVGGKHRSVFVAQVLGEIFGAQVEHLTLGRTNAITNSQ